MSVDVVLTVFGWVAVGWLLVVHVLVERDRIPAHAPAYRIAGCAAAAAVVVGSVRAGLWPVAALGLLWLRTEVFAHRDPVVHERQHVPWSRLGSRALDALAVLFKIELVVIAVVLMFLLGNWLQDNHGDFRRRTDSRLCELLNRDC